MISKVMFKCIVIYVEAAPIIFINITNFVYSLFMKIYSNYFVDNILYYSPDIFTKITCCSYKKNCCVVMFQKSKSKKLSKAIQANEKLVKSLKTDISSKATFAQKHITILLPCLCNSMILFLLERAILFNNEK